MRSLFQLTALAAVLTQCNAQLRVRLMSSSIRDLAEPDFSTFTIESEAESASTSIDGVNLTIAAPEGSYLQGDYYKYQYTRTVSHLGERVVNQGITTNPDAPGAITLSILGLEEGEHTLLTWHNLWSDPEGDQAANIGVSAGGEELASIEPTVRVDNIWESATSYITFSVSSPDEAVEITYTPSGGDGIVYLNGFEIDTPAMGNQISFPTPSHRDERLEPENGTVAATWRAPTGVESATYSVYLGTAEGNLTAVSEGVTETEAIFEDLNKLDTYYWRVDVVSSETTYTGRTFMFRLAHLAFPDAEGWGRFARGGRGGKVVKVTSLEDTEDEGTLRYALTVETGPRTIVFDVGGVITTTSRMSVNGNYITLAGQTAPGKGIAIQGWPVGLSGASDVIFRHIRVRPGTSTGETVDGMGMSGSNYCIFDRCSMGWALDESFSSRTAKNITFQRNMISEPLNVAGHQNYPEGTAHGYAATVGGDVASLHHNLLAHAEGRSWSMGGGVDDNATFAGRLDIRNNVVYNFGTRVTDGGAKEVNFVGNLYKQGPASELTYALQATYEDNLPGTQQYYCSGNSMPGVFDQDSTQAVDDGTGQTSEIACYADVSIDPAPSYQKFMDEEFFPSYIKEQSSTEAYKRVLSDSGVSQPVQDEHDARIVQETLDGTTTYEGSVSGKPGLIDNEADAGGLEDFPETTRSASWDTDNDGIADWWDGSTGGDGYTAVEGYLNFMADPHIFVAPGGNGEVDLAPLFAGFVEPAFTVGESENALGTAAVDGTTATFASTGDAGIDYFTVSVEDSEGSTWERKIGVAIFEGADEAQ
ncbi:pectin lyase fold/virulence factor [Aspergillus stella-maris]|uniref:pectin lyase fold/virulence factor n=1 Tax=Aspergillus stella-maris TaxID=1810926 RepID=UPI003CCD032B